jgi:hypothetical protein
MVYASGYPQASVSLHREGKYAMMNVDVVAVTKGVDP